MAHRASTDGGPAVGRTVRHRLGDRPVPGERRLPVNRPRRNVRERTGNPLFCWVGCDGRAEVERPGVRCCADRENGTLGDLSVTWCKDLSVWLMTYDSRTPRGILFSYARTPWGPWSDPQILFDAVRDGAQGKFIHDPEIKPDDGLAGPVIGKGRSNPGAVRGGAYAPYVVERWTMLRGSELSLYYVLSTWNPYVVVLMESRLETK